MADISTSFGISLGHFWGYVWDIWGYFRYTSEIMLDELCDSFLTDWLQMSVCLSVFIVFDIFLMVSAGPGGGSDTLVFIL